MSAPAKAKRADLSSRRAARNAPRSPFSRAELVEAERVAQEVLAGRRRSYTLAEMRELLAKRKRA